MMKNPLGLLLFSLIIFFVGACAGHPDVRPGTDGLNRVVTKATEQERAARSAISQANDYCKQFKKMAKIVSEKSSYTGELNEDTRKMISKASKAAILIGGMNSSADVSAANPVLGAGTVGSVVTGGEDYQTEMVFECR